ncbi:polysaccharide lyase family 8 super-sandwich domain-containing protein [Vibrio sp. TRT 21S02]|uniref:polysaccharide lyase family 8 super-sandwich domain-containing protein n=1 Tax=Vibrio sp. TRT 21S02 TaxID=3418507 RepID=UPI003CE7595D
MKFKITPKSWVLPALLICQPALATELTTLSQRVAPDFAESMSNKLTSKGENIDQLAAQYVASQQANGSWADIDYSLIPTQEAPVRAHLDRIHILSSAAFLNNDVNAAQAAISALYYWYSADRTNKNWWWNEIGKQLRLGPSALMLGDQLPTDLNQLIAADMPSEPYKTGANRTDLSKGVIFGGLLNQDALQVERGLNGIEETIVVTEDEGVQSDYSFQQHGPQLYIGGYGEVFFGAASYWAYQVRDLQWKFAADKIDVLVNYFLEGVRWANSHGTLDYNSRGRGISRVSTLDPTTLIKQSDYIAALKPTRQSEALAFKQHLQGMNSGLQGYKQFWRSDYAAKVGADHFIGIKMNSNRIRPTEAGNGENLQGNWLGFGSTFIMQRGDEYHNLFPVWNWGLVPGVTSPQFATKPADWGRIEMQTSFVGGVSDGQYGVSVMDMDAYSTQAKKAWFSFKDELVALGAGIKSTRSEYVNTTVNQTRLNGPVTVDGQVYQKGSRQLVGSSWVHHDGVGYVFPASWYGHMENDTKQGNWRSINKGQPDEVVSDDVFMLRIGHSWQPTNASYQYIVLPEKSASDTQAYAANRPVTVLSNTSSLQAVTHTSLNITGIVFHKAGSLVLSSGKEITVDKPSVVLVNESKPEPEITLSTPGLGTLVKVTLTDNGQTQTTTVATSGEKRWLGKSVPVDFSSPALPSQQQTITTKFDAFVRDGKYAGQSYGNNSYLVVKKDGVGYSRKTVLQFDLAGLDVTSTSKATLRLHVRNVNTDPSRDITVSRLSNTDWQESNISWNTLPAVNKTGAIVAVTPNQIGSWLEVDVSDLITTGSLGLVLENKGSASSKSDVSFSSRESGNGPQLIITP